MGLSFCFDIQCEEMKEPVTSHKVCEETFHLLPEKAIFWVEKELLILADLHLGKAGHFRKSGIPVSDLVHSKDMLNLNRLIKKVQPAHVIFLGDLFHSEHNQSWPAFKHWLQSMAPLTFTLVLGNHDVLPSQEYRLANLNVVEKLSIPPFEFTHIPESTSAYNIAGHIHPAIRLTGKGRQSLKVPCFHFDQVRALVPAFGSFTGTAQLQVKAADQVFVVAEQEVIRIN